MKKSFIRSWFEMEVLKNKLRYVLAFIILPAFLAFCVAISKASNTTDSVREFDSFEIKKSLKAL